MSSLFPKEIQKYNAISETVQAFGFIIGPLLGSVIYKYFGYLACFFFISILLALVTPIMHIFIPSQIQLREHLNKIG